MIIQEGYDSDDDEDDGHRMEGKAKRDVRDWAGSSDRNANLILKISFSFPRRPRVSDCR